MKFETTKKINEWKIKHIKKGCISRATCGEQFVYEFLPNAIVECQTIKCLICKKKFTDYID